MNRLIAALISALLLSTGLDTDAQAQPTTASADTAPFQELLDQGIDRFLGTIEPAYSKQIAPGVMEYGFDSEDGPICYTGEAFSMNTRDGSSDNLLIFLQGGGFCSPSNCQALQSGIPLVSFGLLNPNDPDNPAADYDVGYLPYCDGSTMMGDNAVDSDGDGTNDRFFRGIQNLSASLDVISSRYPEPERIVLAGNSAGGFAVHWALPLVRKLYPDIHIDVINDSGQGVFNPDSFATLLEYWNAAAFLPASCNDCIGADGNLTAYHAYQLEQDTNIRMAFISSKQDAMISASLIGGGKTLEAELIEAAAELHEAFPDRFQSLIADGDNHTYILRRFSNVIGGTTVSQWITDMLDGSSAWQSRSD